MLRKISDTVSAKIISAFLIINFLIQIVLPTAAWALTGGPSQPEVQSFQPIGITDMVDPFSGDFSYNIPLIDVGGYPINLIYNAGITMDQEASWVGLGWNVNPGAITRNMRGIPDDFAGDKIEQEVNMEPNRTWGVTPGVGLELFGYDSKGQQNQTLAGNLAFSLGVSFNNYEGMGIQLSANPSINAGNEKESGTGSLGLNITSGQDGLTLSPSLSYSDKVKTKKKDDTEMIKTGANVGVKVNSRAGLKAMTIGMSASGDPTKIGVNKKNPNGKFSADLKGGNGGSAISLSPSTYVPQMDFGRTNTSVSFSGKIGATFIAPHATMNVAGFYSESRLRYTKVDFPAYGYLNEQWAIQENSMLDFNREKDGSFSRSTPNLPITNHTYDVFSISGQGIGGMFRPFRSDVGYLRDGYVYSTGGGGSLGLELASGNAIKLGGDININTTTSHSGLWGGKHNKILDNINFTDIFVNDPYEPVYFKQAGEKTVDDDNDFLQNIGGKDPVRVGINKGPGFSSTAQSEFINGSTNSNIGISQPIRRYENDSYGIKRVKRNMAISYLKAKDAPAFGVQGYVSPHAKSHHIAEVSVLRNDGSRYVYGIAAYNTIQKEVTFNSSGTPGNCATGLVKYSSSDASANNQKGRDHYFNQTTTPPYAHSYLLTSVLSADYSDADDIKGPSLGDLGAYTKFNYDNGPRPNTPALSGYIWRTPYSYFDAYSNEGLKTLSDDDKGSYIYGEKDIWYVSSIESKTHIAVFHTSNRKDGYEAFGEMGGMGSHTTKKLDRIDLYSLPDYKNNPSAATPIKSVHFVYDYSLCGNNNNPLPNNYGDHELVNGVDININKGKLTLKKVYFTYQNSFRGKISPYEFTYSLHNPLYNIKGYDRWGYYKPNDIDNCDLSVSTKIPTADFPYVEQDQAKATEYAESWSLTAIKLPSGGEIEIEYEADDYAYVQDKPAMQMVMVAGTGNDNVYTNSNLLYDGKNTPRKRLYFKFPDEVTSVDKLVEDLLNGGNMYFRFLIDLKTTNGKKNLEYVSGYAKISNAGSCTNPQYGWVEFDQSEDAYKKEDDHDNNKCNPISKTAWQFCRLYNQRLAYDKPDPGKDSGIEQVLKAMVGSVTPFAEILKGPNSYLRAKEAAKEFIIGKSWIRLYNPIGKKYGGGLRVHKLKINDRWEKMNVNYSNNNTNGNNEGFQYGQEYNYTLEGSNKSSGVAAYEPLAGGDENPWHQPIAFTTKHLMAPDDRNYQETPFGESFFPAASVGYSRVTVKNLQRTGVKRHATGKTVHEFYTAKDFPVITKKTGLEVIQQRTGALGSIFNLAHKDFITASQGFAIELNDMHGKPKAQWVYAEEQDDIQNGKPNRPLSGVEFKYNVTTTEKAYPFINKPANPVYETRLNNKVPVIHKYGSLGTTDLVEEKEVGVDYDFVTDFRESETKSNSFSIRGNFAAFLAAIIPIAVPTIFPAYTSEKTRMRSAVATKVVNRYGILKETIAHDLGSQVSTQNMAWDAETGEVLLTKTKNNFNDEVYNFTYPAHWAYDRMAGAYQNINYTAAIAVDFNNNSKFIPTPETNYLVKGDEVLVETRNTTPPFFSIASLGKAWVWDDNENPMDGLYLIDRSGASFTRPNMGSNEPIMLTVKRSGRRNMQTAPIGTITCMKNPIGNTLNGNGRYSFSFTEGNNSEVLNASMQEYSENWQAYCTAKTRAECTCVTDPAKISQWNYFFNQALLPNGIICSDLTHSLTAGHPLLGCTSGNLTWHLPSQVICTTSVNTVNQLSADINISACDIIRCRTTITVTPPLGLPNFVRWYDLAEVTLEETTYENGECIATGEAKFICDGPEYLMPVTVKTCQPFGECVPNPISENLACSPMQPGTVVNPYVTGLRGNWRPKISHSFLTERSQELALNGNYDNTSIRKDGKYTNYLNFWQEPASMPGSWTPDRTDWIYTSEVTEYSPYGFEIENKDALGRYSAAIYGYNNTLPKAVASNAGQPDILFENFEDVNEDDICCSKKSIFFYDELELQSLQESIQSKQYEYAHSGRYSFILPPHVNSNDPLIAATLGDIELTTAPCSTQADNVPYTLKNCDILKEFAPRTYNATGNTDRDYIISFWISVPQQQNITDLDYYYNPSTGKGVALIINTFQGSTPTSIPVEITKSDIIDKWQLITGRFTLQSSDTKMQILISNFSNINGYMDDIRIQPFNSSMKGFVYDPVSLRLWAELDERNYATFYEYDEDGALMRVKKETEKGVMTIQESRYNSAK